MIICSIFTSAITLKEFKNYLKMKTFTIENTEKNNAWVEANLDFRDFTITSFGITIKYFNEMQKNDILNALK